MRRARIAAAALLSLSAHGALILLLLRMQPPREAHSPPVPLEIDVIEQLPSPEPISRPPPGRETAPQMHGNASAPSRHPGNAHSKNGARDGPERSRTEAHPPSANALGHLAGLPRALALEPRWGRLEGGVAIARDAGTLTRNEPGNGPDPQAAAAEEGRRVGARVEAISLDTLASLRVADGAVDTYFSDLRKALERSAAKPPAFTEHGALGSMVKAWRRGAESYGAHGNPSYSGPLPDHPTREELLDRADRVGEGSAGAPKLGAAEYQQLSNFIDSMGRSGLFAVVEVRQSASGRLLDARLVEPSGNKLFDQHVLSVVPSAIEPLAPPPSFGGGIHPEGMRSRWSFEGRVSYLRRLNDGFSLARDGWYAALASMLGAIKFDETTGEAFMPDFRAPQFTCKVRLLRVY